MAPQDVDYLDPEVDSQEPDDEDQQRKRGTRDEREEESSERKPSKAEEIKDLKKRIEEDQKRFKETQKGAKQANKQVDKEFGQIKKATAQSKQATRTAARGAARQAGSTAARETAQQGFRASLRAGMMAGRAAYVAGAGETMGITLAIGLATELALQLLLHPKKTTKRIFYLFLALGLGILAIMLLIITVLNSIIMEKYGPDFLNDESLLVLTKSGPTEANRGDRFSYTINVAYPKPFQEIEVNDRLPEGLIFDGSDQIVTYDPSSRTVVWKASENNFTDAPLNTNFTIRVFVAVDNFHAINWAEGVATPVQTAGGSYTPANPNNCGGIYDFSQWPEENPLGNFGDPLCNYSKEALFALLTRLDQRYVHSWEIIITRETGGTFSPNAFSGLTPEQIEIDACGAWGLYQMGSSGEKLPAGSNFLCTPGLAPPAPGKNGIYDRGDVNWELQTSNAINYNRRILMPINCDFWYWRSAREGELPPGVAKPC